jgi:MoaA/NifB/PqqE/SkfB family radical SAM enzyme
LSNRIFYRKKQKDREHAEAAAMSHPLVKSWEYLSKKDAVERISLVRMNKFLNRQGNHLEMLLQCTSFQTYPSRITIEPTSACNYRCTMCPQGHYTERPSYFEIDDDAVERALPVLEFVENLATQVTGEPTLSLQLGKIANYASCHGVHIDMITNASLLHKTNADLNKFSIICISFDGATKEVFEAQRVGSSFENVLKNVRLTREQNPLVEIEFNVCVTRLNIAQLADIVHLAAELGVDRVRFNPLNTREYPHLASLALGENIVDELNVAINAAREAAVGTSVRVFNFVTDQTLTSEKVEDALPVAEILTQLSQLETKNSALSPELAAGELIAMRFPLLPDVFGMISKELRFDSFQEQLSEPEMVNQATIKDWHDDFLPKAIQGLGRQLRLPFCTAPYKGGIIFANGVYTPCCYMAREASFGSIRSTPFAHVWNSPGLQEMRRSMFNDAALLPVCRNCNGRQRYTFTIELLHLAHRLGYKWEDIIFPTNFNPPAMVKAQINALRDKLFKPGTAYTLDTPLTFGAEGNAHPFMSSGFSIPGVNGVWIDGFEAVLTLQVLDGVSSDLMLDVSLLPFLHSDLLPRQRIEVSVNRRPIDCWQINRPIITKCQAAVPLSLVGADGKVQFTFRFPDASSWRHLGVNKIKETRSVMFVEARLAEKSGQELHHESNY